MSSADAVAAVLWVGVSLYAVFGGADFGSGFWALVAGGGKRGRRARALIDWAIGPVWEANHVWLIFMLVTFWTAFPEAFASVTSTLFIPLSLAALGIVLRGAGFAFHRVDLADEARFRELHRLTLAWLDALPDGTPLVAVPQDLTGRSPEAVLGCMVPGAQPLRA